MRTHHHHPSFTIVESNVKPTLAAPQSTRNMTRRESAASGRNTRKTRIVRSITMNHTPTPIISKHLIDVGLEEDEEFDDDYDSSGSSSVLQNQKCTETALDRIIRKLQRDTWPADVIILITPASRHKQQYKLHLIDRHGQGHLGMTSITKKELIELRSSKAFRQYSTILSTKYLDLKTVAVKTAIIDDLVHTLNGERMHSKCYFIKTRSHSREMRERRERAQAAINEYQQQQQYLRDYQDYREFQDTRHIIDARLIALLERINSPSDTLEKDLRKFFDLAEKCKFKIYVRPELCWKTTTELDRGDLSGDMQRNLVRFNIEFFMIFDHYVGGITLNAEQLREQLAAHAGLLPRVQIIKDVCELTPLPQFLICLLRSICAWLRMEMVYDAFGEFVFDLYKQYA